MNVYLAGLLVYSVLLMSLGVYVSRRIKVVSAFLGPKLWEIANRRALSTMGDFLEYRYNRAVKAVIAVLLWLGTLAILAGQLIAISWILHVVIGLPKWLGCTVGGVGRNRLLLCWRPDGGGHVNVAELTMTMSGLLLAVPFALHSLGGWSHASQLILQATLLVSRFTQGGWWIFSPQAIGISIAFLTVIVCTFVLPVRLTGPIPQTSMTTKAD